MTSNLASQNVQQIAQQSRRVCGYPVKIVWPESSKSPDDPAFHITADICAWLWRRPSGGRTAVRNALRRKIFVQNLTAARPDVDAPPHRGIGPSGRTGSPAITLFLQQGRRRQQIVKLDTCV